MQELLSLLTMAAIGMLSLFGCIFSARSKSTTDDRGEDATSSEHTAEDAGDTESEQTDVDHLLERIDGLADRIDQIATSETDKWNERVAQKDLDVLLQSIYNTADTIRDQTKTMELPEVPAELETMLETVRVRMLQARDDIRQRTNSEREFYQLVTMLNQAVLQVKSGMKSGKEGRELVQNALRE
ncbi:hypothetical protein EU546_08150, partial [Candidatus Thorarchaeota archaeon]